LQTLRIGNSRADYIKPEALAKLRPKPVPCSRIQSSRGYSWAPTFDGLARFSSLLQSQVSLAAQALRPELGGGFELRQQTGKPPYRPSVPLLKL